MEARIGWFRSRVAVDGVEWEVRKGRDGWLHVIDAAGRGGRVRYDGWRDRLAIDSPYGYLEIRFRWRNTTFSWGSRTYRVTSMLWGRVAFLEGTQTVAEGRMTWSGIRFDLLPPEFRGIERELAVGLGLRAQVIASAAVAAAG